MMKIFFFILMTVCISHSMLSQKNFFEVDSAMNTAGYLENESSNISGVRVEYYENGKVHSIQNYKCGLLNGESLLFYKTGNIKALYYYVNGKKNGKFITFHNNGYVRSVGRYAEGIYIGNKSDIELENYGLSGGMSVLIGNYWEYDEDSTVKKKEMYSGRFFIEEIKDSLGYMEVIRFEKHQ